jgi:hypothetical protein
MAGWLINDPAGASEGELQALAPTRDPGENAFQSSFDMAAEESLGPLILRAAKQGVDVLGQRTGMLPAVRMLDPEEANDLYGIEDALSFDGRVSETYAAERWAIKQRELAADDALARSSATKGFWGGARVFGSSFAGSMTDPVQWGLAAIPMGELGLLAKAVKPLGSLARSEVLATRVFGRAVLGVSEGAILGGAYELAAYPLMTWREGRDYEFTDALANVAMGGILGGAGGALGGALEGGGRAIDGPRVLAGADPLEAARAPEPEARVEPMPDRVANAPQEAREAATAASIGQLAAGEPVDVAPVFSRVDEAKLAEIAGRPDIPVRKLKPADVYSPGGMAEAGHYAIVDVEDLVTSNGDDLTVNPDYPGAMQPRDRTRAASEMQVRKFGEPFQPARWGETAQGDSGAPVIGSDGVVESGNGRTIWLRRAYRGGDPRAEEMRAWLKSQGYPVDGVKNPVLVRVLPATREPAQRVRFAEDLNKPASAVMSAAETAFSDARRLSAAVLDLHQGGDAGMAGNVHFQRAAIEALTTEQERGALIDSSGRLSKAGEQRLEAALMAKAYGDERVISARFEDLDETLKTAGGALQDAAPIMARLADALDSGQVGAEFDLRGHISAAMALMRRAGQAGKSIRTLLSELESQGDMFGGGPSGETLQILLLMVDDKTGRVRARVKIAENFEIYAKAALASPEPVLFDDARITPAKAFDAAARATGRESGAVQSGLFEGNGGGAAERGSGAVGADATGAGGSGQERPLNQGGDGVLLPDQLSDAGAAGGDRGLRQEPGLFDDAGISQQPGGSERSGAPNGDQGGGGREGGGGAGAPAANGGALDPRISKLNAEIQGIADEVASVQDDVARLAESGAIDTAEAAAALAPSMTPEKNAKLFDAIKAAAFCLQYGPGSSGPGSGGNT